MKIDEALVEVQRVVANLEASGYRTTSVEVNDRTLYLTVEFKKPNRASLGGEE